MQKILFISHEKGRRHSITLPTKEYIMGKL